MSYNSLGKGFKTSRFLDLAVMNRPVPFRHLCLLELDSVRPRKNCKIEPDFGIPSALPWYQSLIPELSLSIRCIGNGIHFPINVVNDLALQLRDA